MPRIPKRIGVLTGGGDCPGLNAAIRAVAKSAMFEHGMEVFGIEDGFLGLIENRVRRLQSNDVSGILTLGGTMLGTSNKANPARYATGYDESGEPVFKDLTDDCMGVIDRHGLEAIVVIGGDGTMTCANPFAARGVNIIGVPKTIDNDLVGSEITIGFDTAVEVAVHALDRLHTTAMSHHRVIVVEVMGRNAGWIALHAGVASGSDVITLPEIPYDLRAICDFVSERSRSGKRFSLICCAEGAKPAGGQQTVSRIDPTSPEPIRLGGIGEQLAEDISRVTGLETRATVLGHVIRGGTPSSSDRTIATLFGRRAVTLLAKGATGRVVVMSRSHVSDVAISDVADRQRLVNPDDDLVKAALAVGTCMGV